jgi:hypothetical protein
MSVYKDLDIFCKNHGLDPGKPSTWEDFKRDRVGLPWGAGTVGGTCPSCGKSGCRKVTGARWYCFYCGESGGINCEGLTSQQQQAERELLKEKREADRERALKIWDQCERGITNVALVRTYLATRCLSLEALPDPDRVMRWHPRCPFGPRNKEPCIVSLFRDALTDRPTAVHRTHITSASAGRSERMAMGPMAGSAIKLWPLKGEALAVGEGIETVLAALELGVGTPPAWAATVAGNLSRLPVIPNVRRLTILADNDPHNKGEEHARSLRKKWLTQGKEVVIKSPEEVKDFNDVLIRRWRP